MLYTSHYYEVDYISLKLQLCFNARGFLIIWSRNVDNLRKYRFVKKKKNTNMTDNFNVTPGLYRIDTSFILSSPESRQFKLLTIQGVLHFINTQLVSTFITFVISTKKKVSVL